MPTTSDYLPYYRLKRDLTAGDLSLLREADPLTALMVSDGVAVHEAALAVVHHEQCGDPPLPVSETFMTRPIWIALAEIQVDAQRATLRHLQVEHPVGELVRDWDDAVITATAVDLPEVPISGGTSVVLPIATLLPRFPLLEAPLHELDYNWDRDDERSQTESYGDLGRQSFDLWGPAVLPVYLRYEAVGRTFETELRRFDPGRTFVIDRNWMVGSCPHVFEIDGSGRSRYVASAFTKAPSTTQTFTYHVEGSVDRLVVSELEDEITTLDEVRLDGHLVAEGVVLRRGESFSVSLSPGGGTLTLVGSYATQERARMGTAALRNAYIRDAVLR